MAVLLGVMVAVSFGSGDFFGGQATRQASALGVLVISQACGLAVAAILAIAVATTVTGNDLVFGACAGVVNMCGLGLLYYALSRYAVGVVAPVAAVVGAVVPIRVGCARRRTAVDRRVGRCGPGDRRRCAHRARTGCHHRWLRGGGGDRGTRRTRTRHVARPVLGDVVRFGHVAGAAPAPATAAFLVWAVALALLARKRPPRMPRANGPALAVIVGALDVTATALLLLTIRRGLIVVVAPIASLAPGFTVLLAWRLLGERLVSVQRVGLVCALVGLVLVSVG